MPKVYTPTDDLLEQIEDGIFTNCLKLCLIFLGYAGFGFFVWDILKMVLGIPDATRVEIDKILDARKVEVENLNSPSPSNDFLGYGPRIRPKTGAKRPPFLDPVEISTHVLQLNPFWELRNNFIY